MSERRAFYFDGESSLDYGLYISGNQTFNAPKKKLTKVSVPGRNGDLVFFDGSYENYDYKYDSFLVSNLNYRIREFNEWLMSKNGYFRLEDDYHPEIYRMAMFKGPIDFDVILLEAGTTTLTFDCKPQKFLKIGEDAINCGAEGQITIIDNPTKFYATPIIKVAGTGTVSFSIEHIDYNPAIYQTTIYGMTMDESKGRTVVESEIEQAYYEKTGEYVNNRLELTNNRFPRLAPGLNRVSCHGTSNGASVSSLEITPRWFSI